MVLYTLPVPWSFILYLSCHDPLSFTCPAMILYPLPFLPWPFILYLSCHDLTPPMRFFWFLSFSFISLYSCYSCVFGSDISVMSFKLFQLFEHKTWLSVATAIILVCSATTWSCLAGRQSCCRSSASASAASFSVLRTRVGQTSLWQHGILRSPTVIDT